MKVRHIEVLVAISDAGSLRGAAEVIGKSQPALTKILRQAEYDLGAPLFHRSSRGVVPTKIGERVLGRARTITTEITKMKEEVSQLMGELVGQVNVCVSPYAAFKIMPRALELFRKSYPDIRVTMHSGLFPVALKPLREGLTDFIIGPAPPLESAADIHIEPLIEMPIAVVTSSTSNLLRAKSLRDLMAAQWIMIGAPDGPGDIFFKPFIQHGLKPPNALTTSESYFGALSLVESLGAVCTFPLLLLEDLKRTWGIQQILIQEKIDPLQIVLMTRAGHPLTPAADALVNCVRRRVQSVDNRR